MKKLLMTLPVVVALTGCNVGPSVEDLDLAKLAGESLKALPKVDEKVASQTKIIALGEKLYFEKAMSKNGTISCNSCHGLATFGVDNEPTSPGFDGTRGGRNSPTVYNSHLHLAQFWDGRSPDVEDQALGPLLNPIEHGMASEEEVMDALKKHDYKWKFQEAFESKDAFTFKNIGKAIGAFERTLVHESRFDDFMNGKFDALTAKEKKGLKKFVEIGCTSCHSGAGVGGSMYMKMGAVNEYPGLTDKGRYEVTKQESDMHVFKVPGLRNIAMTAPYFHDGKVETLEEAIKLMAYHQLDEKLSDEDVQDIKAFLESLTAKNLKY